VRASYPGNAPDTRWQSLMSKSFGGICEPGQRRQTCLSLLDNMLGLSERDKLAVALGLSIEPLKQSISRAVEKTLAPQHRKDSWNRRLPECSLSSQGFQLLWLRVMSRTRH
jgi:hypothetical protein